MDTTIHALALKHGVPETAIRDAMRALGITNTRQVPVDGAEPSTVLSAADVAAIEGRMSGGLPNAIDDDGGE